ncbi:altronate oxidoreductase [Chitinophaga caeni]|uniref:Altronate oxidoreductase n=1 Tax=Chitinophaga caeni TaxID=2029983 RepID=A0A291QPC1_9BACT|nr:tagaturonate reductase [Chitinophaga caeni]ATL45765.1 altronate oxidoreductase [Chitinophaga caeni]
MFPVLSKSYVLSKPEMGIEPALFELPEKILQFGTGVLLRGLVDYLVDKANKEGIFNGRIVVVKSTSGDTQEFDNQDCLYTTNIKGVAHNQLINRSLVNLSIARVLQSVAKWKEILGAVEQPGLEIIISNTTEVGIQYSPESVLEGVPSSYPGKLLAILWHRYQFFKEDAAERGFVIIPTELVVDNGKLLREAVLKLADYNKLPEAFTDWIKNANQFCSSLVDRIVPGKPKELQERWTEAGYEDHLWINTEPYLLWAIEGDEKVRQKLSFHRADDRMHILPDITPFREQKLRILNGSHTAAAPTGFLVGLQTVYECMQHDVMQSFFKTVTRKEIAPTLEGIVPDAEAFANEVLERFANPYIVHPLINITLQQSTKLEARNALTILRYNKKFNRLPPMLCLGFASSLYFLKPVVREDKRFFGQFNEQLYEIKDDQAITFNNAWADVNDLKDLGQLKHFVEHVGKMLFSEALFAIEGFSELIAIHLLGMFEMGPNQYLTQYINEQQLA